MWGPPGTEFIIAFRQGWVGRKHAWARTRGDGVGYSLGRHCLARCSLFAATADLGSLRSLGGLSFSAKSSLVVADPNEAARHSDGARPQSGLDLILMACKRPSNPCRPPPKPSFEESLQPAACVVAHPPPSFRRSIRFGPGCFCVNSSGRILACWVKLK